MEREIKFDVLIRNKTTGNCHKCILTIDDLLDRNGSLYNQNVQEIVYKRQFTGLRDKNGKEIYEGDILIYPHENIPCLVAFKNGCFITDDLAKSNSSLGDILPECEIIGNIYENPELLK